MCFSCLQFYKFKYFGELISIGDIVTVDSDLVGGVLDSIGERGVLNGDSVNLYGDGRTFRESFILVSGGGGYTFIGTFTGSGSFKWSFKGR